MSWFNDLFKKKTEYVTAPEYPEATNARKELSGTLTDWGNDPYYGAVQPDWADIWQNAQDKIRRYYWGSPTQMGLSGKVKASAAKRGVSDSPALDANLTAMGVEEGNQIKDQATQQGIQKTNLAESGRNSWLNALMGLSQQKPQSELTTQTPAWLQLLSAVVPIAAASMGKASVANNYSLGGTSTDDWLKKLLNQGLPNTTQSSIK